MGISIKRTGAADYGRFMKLLICGAPGSGKTLISSTFPSPIYASAEGGLMSIASRNIPYVEVRSSLDLLYLKNILDQAPPVREELLGFKVETVVIDTIDEVQRILIRERLEETKKESLALPDWGWLGEQMQAIISGFRNLDLNVVFTCHLKETSDAESGRLYFKPGLQGAIGDQIPAYVDLALLLKAQTAAKIVNGEAVREVVRVLQTNMDPQHPWIKDRSGQLPMDLEVDFQQDWKRLYDLIYGDIADMPEQVVMQIGEVTTPEAEVTTAPSTESRVRTKAAPPLKKPSPAPAKPQVKEVPATPEKHVDRETGEITAVNSDASQAQPEPEPKPAPKESVSQPETPEPVSTPEPVGTGIVCTQCQGAVESEDQADLSRIRFRRILCRSCFVEAKKK